MVTLVLMNYNQFASCLINDWLVTIIMSLDYNTVLRGRPKIWQKLKLEYALATLSFEITNIAGTIDEYRALSQVSENVTS